MSTSPDVSVNKPAEISPVKRALIALEEMKLRLQASEQRLVQPLAVIGVGCRFPGGADDLEQCWTLLREGRDAIVEVPQDRWDIDAYFDPDPDAPGKMSTRWGGFIRDVDRFDAELFGISPREAVTMDPQQRILLEVVWEALERAGQSPEALSGSRTGVFLGIATNDYARILAQNTPSQRIDAYFASGVAHSIASGRVSYCLGLQGPSVSIDTACSSSLVAVHQACQSLRTGESDMAIAAGVNVLLRPDHGITFSKSRMMARDGRCKAFDARADGFVRAEGCGAVVLKRLADAQAAGDPILAIVRGTAVNQDGASSGLTAPNGASQEALIRAALADAGIAPHEVGYIEAHGTGTSLGDPIEVRALGSVFGRGRDARSPLLIGSSKTNFGHLEAAAGIAGLIKTVLSLTHREIPPSLHLQEPNPHIAWDELPIRVATRAQPFPSYGGRRIAGVSSFGFSGTNAHVVLEEAPQAGHEPRGTRLAGAAGPEPRPAQPISEGGGETRADVAMQADEERTLHLLPLSAKSDAALRALASRYASHLQSHPEQRLADICHTAASARAHLPHRLAIAADDRDSMARSLREFAAGEQSAADSAHVSVAARPKVAFLFTGQGSQYVGMGRELYASEPTFRAVLDRCAAALQDELPRSLLEVMFEDTGGLLDQTLYTQPALYALEVGMAQLWREWGIEPSLVLGHSVGEYAAACVAGVLSVEDGARLIGARARLMQALPAGGGMIAVQGDGDIVEPAVERALAGLDADVAGLACIAARNAPGSIVVAGADAALASIAPQLQRTGLVVTRLAVSHAFHSPLIDPMLPQFASYAQLIAHRAPQLGWISNLTGELLHWNDWSTRMGEYWRRHVRQPVLFEQGVRCAAAQGIDVFLEVGPHPVLAGLGRATLARASSRVLWLASLQRERAARKQMLEALSRLYLQGVKISWSAVDAHRARRTCVLPTYPFQRERYWVEMLQEPGSGASVIYGDTLLGRRVDTPAVSGALFESRFGPQTPAAFALDHRVFGMPILPGSGFIAMVLEAVRHMHGATTTELRDVSFDEVLPVPESGSREVQLIARREEGGQARALRVEIFSRERGGDAWILHATAMGTCVPDEMPAPVGSPSAGADYDVARGRCVEVVGHEAFYADLRARGLDFGPLFRGLHAVRRNASEVTAEASLPAELHSEAARYPIHPVLLDAALQALASAVAPIAGADALFLPVQIDRCRVVGVSDPLLACRAHALVRNARADAELLTADIYVSDPSGRPIVQLERVHLKRAARGALDRSTAREIEDWLIELDWERCRGGSASSCLAIAAAVEPGIAARVEASGWRLWAQVQPQLDRICRGYIARALRTLGCGMIPGERFETAALAERLGVKPGFHKLLERFLAILAAGDILRRDAGGWIVLRAPAVVDLGAELLTLHDAHPEFEAELTFAERCGPHIADALSGRCDPLQLLFPGGDSSIAERLYRDSPSARLYNGILGEVVAEILARLPSKRRVRVLEIGGGTASTTAHVLEKLPADRIEYVFTDISPLFVARAQERFSPLGFVRAHTLDIERDPAEQGIEGEFDIVIAANVLHATRNLATSFAHLRKLLARDGMLVALEITRPQDWVDISFGFTEGWWRFEESDLRPHYPLLSRAQWREFLQAQGFSDVTLLPQAADDVDPLSLNTVIVAGAPPAAAPSGTAAAQEEPLDAARRWLVLCDEGGLGTQLAAQLTRAGDLVCTAHARTDGSVEHRPGSHRMPGGDRPETSQSPSFHVDPRSCTDLERLLEDAQATLGGAPLDGIVHLWSLDARLQRPEDSLALKDASERLHGGLLHLGQALLSGDSFGRASAPPPALYVVTRGGVLLGGQPVQPLSASLWGWARSLRLERPELRCISVDLDPADAAGQVSAIEATLRRRDDENQIAWRERCAHVARLRRPRTPAQADDAAEAPLRLLDRSRGVIDSLSLEPLQRLQPGEGEVEIRVRAAGLNFRDVLAVLDMYPGDRGPLGSECSGQIVAVGPGVESLCVGDEVVAIAPGAFATHVIAKAALVVPKPAALTHAEAASLPNAFLTARWALHRLGGLKAGDRVLIHAGTGGVGLAAIELAQRAGAEVYATAGNEEKRMYLRSLGVENIYSSRSLDFAEQVRAATGGRGVDLVLNSLAGEFIASSIALVAPGGTFLEIGRTNIWSPERVGRERPDIAYHAIDLSKDYFATPELIRPMLREVLEDVSSGRGRGLPVRCYTLQQSAAAFRFMAQARHIGKLVLSDAWAPASTADETNHKSCSLTQAVSIRSDATYWITGGLSGLGLAVAGWLVERGARHLLLMGRRAPAVEAGRSIESMRAQGAQVVIAQGDVSNAGDMRAALEGLDAASMPALAGVVHAAGSLEDGLLAGQSLERYARVFAAKIEGAWLIDRMTRSQPLDFLVFFSSVAGLLGSAGQTNHGAANAYLDGLAAQLRAEGRPAVSIQWGAWAEIGAAAGEDVAARLAEKGLQPIAPRQGLAAFAQVLRRMPVHAGIVKADWSHFTDRLPPTVRSYVADLSIGTRGREATVDARSEHVQPRKTATAPSGMLRERLAAAPAERRRTLLQAEVRAHAMRVLSLPATHKIDMKAPLNGLGLDSLMAVELRNLLGRAIGQPLPATLLFDYPSIEALTAHIAALIELEPTGRDDVVAELVPGAEAAPMEAEDDDSTAELLARVEQLSEEELDRLLNAKTKVH